MKLILYFFLIISGLNCREKIKVQEDGIYSRHLQRKVNLSIINTPVPSEKSELHLLLLNDGQEIEKLRVQSIVDSLYEKDLIKPLVIVAIHAGDRMQEYGVADRPDYDGRGSKANYYDNFINNELYPFAKKKAGIRKFKSVAIAGASLGGLSAFDIAWNHSDKINKVGVFSGSFWWRDKDTKDSSYSDDKNRIMLSKLKSSHKKPKLQYWFYAGGSEETSDRDKDGIVDVVDDTRDIIKLLLDKNITPANNIIYKEEKNARHDWEYWSKAFPEFLIWAFGS